MSLPHTMAPVALGNMTGAEADWFVRLRYKAGLLIERCEEVEKEAELLVEEELDNIDQRCMHIV